MSFDRNAFTIDEAAFEERQAVTMTNFIPNKLTISSLQGVTSLFKKPVKQYDHINKENEIKLRPIPALLWVHVYHFLDARSLIILTMACKTFGTIANDPAIRSKLYHAQENKKYFNIKKLFWAQPSEQGSTGVSVTPSSERLTHT
jgi:hypothetical protein